MNLMDHKTKITGGLLTLISLVQANSDVFANMLSPKAFSWLTAVIGIAVTALGFSNSSNSNKSPPPATATK